MRDAEPCAIPTRKARGPSKIPLYGKLTKSLNPDPKVRASPPGAPRSSKELIAQPNKQLSYHY